MPVCISDIPYDIVHHVASHLSVRDYHNLSRVNRKLYRDLQDPRTIKKALQTSFADHHYETTSILEGNNVFRQVIAKTFDQIEAQRTASPYSISIIAYGTSFCFSQGCLCYSTTDEIHLLNLEGSPTFEKIIDRGFFSIQDNHEEVATAACIYPRSMTVVSYDDDTATVVCNYGSKNGQYLFAVCMSTQVTMEPRVLLCERLRSTSKLFVRNTADCLYYGTHSAMGSNGHHEWLIHGFNLKTSKPFTEQPFQLYGFPGSEIGQTVCFTIYNGEFYALTSQTSFESEEVDWTSYYHYVRFPLGTSKNELFPLASSPRYGISPLLKMITIFRRQHLEGPIHDAWTDLSFQVDERTGELLIVECRREWLNGSTNSERICYIEPFERALHGNTDDRISFSPNDPLARTIESSDRCRWEGTPKSRIEKYVHRESTHNCEENGQSCNSVQRKEYLRAKTKWNGYNYNNNSFVDIVVEDHEVPGQWRTRERIKLRVASRLPKNPLIENNADRKWTFISKLRDKNGRNVEDSDEAFTESQVFLWPDTDIPDELNEILCPGGKAGEVKAMMCDTGLIYTAGPPKENGERALIYISFDPSWGFDGMKRLDGSLAKPKSRSIQQAQHHNFTNQGIMSQSKKRDAFESERGIPMPSVTTSKKLKPDENNHTSTTSTPLSQPLSSAAGTSYTTTKKAMYLDIRKGYWLR